MLADKNCGLPLSLIHFQVGSDDLDELILPSNEEPGPAALMREDRGDLSECCMRLL